ncbi:hypothetical protein AGMMS49944_32110 [Spirochaetia bacterium]|nr:hypothetical protein AGMMS49944_32110 [Spirochaetia bacterium]
MCTVRKLTDTLLASVCKEIPNVQLNGHPQNRIPGGLHFSIYNVDMRSIIKQIPNIIVSTGMACSGTDNDPIIAAISKAEDSRYSLRIQLGFENTNEEIAYFIQSFSKKIADARNFWGNL